MSDKKARLCLTGNIQKESVGHPNKKRKKVKPRKGYHINKELINANKIFEKKSIKILSEQEDYLNYLYK